MPEKDGPSIRVYFNNEKEKELAQAMFNHIKFKTGKNNGEILRFALHDYNLTLGVKQ